MSEAHYLERALQTLEVYGVPRERARNVPNGIEVLAKRMRLESQYIEAALGEMHAALEALVTADDAKQYENLDRGIGTATEKGRRWLYARSLVNQFNLEKKSVNQGNAAQPDQQSAGG